MTPESQALQTYHARYNNITYRAAQAAIVTDLHGPLVASQPMTLDEALTNAADLVRQAALRLGYLLQLRGQ